MATPKRSDRLIKKLMADKKGRQNKIPKKDSFCEEDHKKRIQSLIDSGVIKC